MKLEDLENELECLAAEEAGIVTERAPELHPNLPELYRRRVADFEAALKRTPTEQAAAGEILRSLIARILVHPGKGRGEVQIQVEGSIPAILDFAQQRRERSPNRSVAMVVPRGGFEPPTPAFSVQCSTN
jgi:site-specific DNA recombinase